MEAVENNMKERDIENFISVLLKYKEKVTKTPKTSKKFLVDLGVITEKGNLKKHYKEICILEEQE